MHLKNCDAMLNSIRQVGREKTDSKNEIIEVNQSLDILIADSIELI